MDLAVTMLIGLAVGAMVELLLPGHHASELVLAMLLGIAGALLARFAGSYFGWFETDAPGGFLSSLAGAILMLMLYGVLFRRRRGRG
jgi:uncharacterized membrane protein YeaQ/YmgE (transglycosylase-associated protein family)